MSAPAFSHYRAQAGKIISAAGLRQLADTCDWISRLRVAAPLEMTRNPGGGPTIRLKAVATSVVEAIVTTAITPCMGTTYGTGQAQIYMNKSGNAIVDPTYPNPVDILNWFQNSGTIAVGKHVMIAQRSDGWRLVSGDC